MKKILSLFVFIALMIWTWNIIHSTASVGFETHNAIQLQMAELIENTLKQKKPEMTELIFTKLWTENLDAQKVRAVFAYRFKEQTDEREIAGEALLTRQPSDDPSVDNWKLLEVKTTGDAISYQDGSSVTPEEDATEPATPPQQTPPPAAPSTHQ